MQPLNEKWMGIDYGLARIGVAVSDPMGRLARGLETIRWNGRDLPQIQDRLVYLAQQHQVTGIVLGYPDRTDGRHAMLTEQVRSLATYLEEKTGRPVLLRDERFTTVIAQRRLRDRGIKDHKHRAIIDQVAAEIILQEHLDSRRKSGC